MTIKDISLRRLRIPLKVRFSQSNNTTRTSDSIIVSLQTTTGIIGYGESCPRPYVTGEDHTSVVQDIDRIKHLLAGRTFSSIAAIRSLIMEELVEQHPVGLSSRCAIEIALLDAWSKENQTSLITALGGDYKEVMEYTGVIPMGNLQKLRPILERFSFDEVKIKIGTNLEETIERILILKSIYHPDIRIRVDANCSWGYGDACAQVPVLIQAGVHTFEQMFPKGMEVEMGKITEKYGDQAFFMADESVTSYESAKSLLENKQCNRINLKISKHGGIFHTLAICELAKKHGIVCQLGAHFGETSILTTAGIIVSSIAREITTHEGGLGTLLLESDISSRPISINMDGEMRDIAAKLSPTGLGPAIDPAKLEAYSVLFPLDEITAEDQLA